MANTSSLDRPLAIHPTGDPVVFSLGRYDREQTPFVVEVDAKPLAVLVEEAFLGSRVYELMTIARPGDIYNYLRVRLVEVSKSVISSALGLKSRWVLGERQDELSDGYTHVPLPRFDSLFYWDGDDTSPEAGRWLAFREGSYWRTTAVQLLAWVKAKQMELRSTDDWLTLREVAYIDQGSHRRDFLAENERRCVGIATDRAYIDAPQSVRDLIDKLVTRENVQSVSVPFTDFRIWQRLVQEQLVRSDQTGYPPGEAFPLSASDSGLHHVPYEDWGGNIHIPYEGACMADLFVLPGYRKMWPEQDNEGGSLTDVVCYAGESLRRGDICHYVLLHNDLGPLKCATRTVVGDGWFLYESNRPYVPNPLRKPHLGGDD